MKKKWIIPMTLLRVICMLILSLLVFYKFTTWNSKLNTCTLLYINYS